MRRTLALPSRTNVLAARTVEVRLVPSLALWLTLADCLHVPPLHPEIAAYLTGEARLVRCRFEGCANSQRWEGGT